MQGQAALVGGGDHCDDLPEPLQLKEGQERPVQLPADAAAARRIGGEKDGQLGNIAIARLRAEGLGAGVAQEAARFILGDQVGIGIQLGADIFCVRLHVGVDLVKGGCRSKHVMAVGVMDERRVLGRGDAKLNGHLPPPPSRMIFATSSGVRPMMRVLKLV